MKMNLKHMLAMVAWMLPMTSLYAVEDTNNNIVINEVMASNVDEYISPAFNFDGWIELYNPTGKDVPLAGLRVSDPINGEGPWVMPSSAGVVPAHGFKVIWFDSNNIKTNQAIFKLDTDGGTLVISDKDGNELVRQPYPASLERVSYARITDGADEWGWADRATPGSTNNGIRLLQGQLDAPLVNEPSQLFSGQLNVSVKIPAGTTLYYTIDGKLPTKEGGRKSSTGLFSVTKTMCYRFRLFADDKLPSPVTTRSYLLRDKDYTLPVISVVTDPDFLYSTEIGVFEKGPNGRPGNGQSSKCNWNMDWERPVNFSFLTAAGDMALNQDVNLEMCGGWSRAYNPRSFKLKGNKELGGNKNLLYPFFDEKPYIRNRTLQIRNGGNDNWARFKDPSLQYLIKSSGIDIDYQSYQPVHEFINGSYIGVLNMREPNNKHHVYANYGWDDDEIDQFEMSPDSGYVQKCGTKDAFNDLVKLSADAANAETYDEIRRMLDVDAYINYMAAEFYICNWDWPQNNVKGFRHHDGGKFRFVLFDLDGAFNTDTPFETFFDKERYTFDQLYPTNLGRKTDNILFVTLFKNLLKNSDFRRQFIDAFCMMGGSVFERQRVTAIIDMLASRVNPALALEGANANGTANDVKNGLATRLQSVARLLRNNSNFKLSGATVRQYTLNSDVEGAQLTVNGQTVPTRKFDGYLFPPVSLQAVAPAGYVFQGWRKSAGNQTLLSRGASWYYYDGGSLDNANWTSPTYQATGWKTGAAPLGYGKSGVKTTISYGSNANSKRPTYYFRKTVTLAAEPKASDMMLLGFTVDDGIVVYVNGHEAGRYNMPTGTIRYNTYASSYAPGNPDEGSLNLPIQYFHQGDNVIAVELHNNSGSSTDIYWDAQLETSVGSVGSDIYSTEATITLPSENLRLTACYDRMDEAQLKAQGITPVRINEISGSNDSYIDEYGKKGDWVELYNTTDEEIDVEGMYLSDNTEKPTKYQISKEKTNAVTKIPAHGYLIVWCDKRATTDRGLHASFKISDDGGEMVLTAADRSWSDVMTYGDHDANTTIARYPDGCANVFATNVPTIGRSNLSTSYMTAVEQSAQGTGIKPLISAANGMRLRYGSQQLLLKSEENGCAVIAVFTADGRLVEEAAVTVVGETARLDVSNLVPGFYVARAVGADGQRVSCKFMK